MNVALTGRPTMRSTCQTAISTITMQGFTLVIITALVAGCTLLPVSSTENPAPVAMESRTVHLVPGETVREEIHAALGEPLASTGDGRIEVFLAASERAVVSGIMIVAVVPLPVAGPSDVMHCYVMTQMDDRDILIDARSGCVQYPGDVTIAIGDVEFRAHNNPGNSLPPKEFKAQHGSDPPLGPVAEIFEEALIEPMPERLPPTPAGHCRILFAGMPRSSAGHSIEVRDQFRFQYGPVALEGLVQRYIPSGRHRAMVRLSHVVWSDRQRLKAEFDCEAGETLVLRDTVDYAFMKHFMETGVLDKSLDGLGGGLLVESLDDTPVEKQKILTFYRSH